MLVASKCKRLSSITLHTQDRIRETSYMQSPVSHLHWRSIDETHCICDYHVWCCEDSLIYKGIQSYAVLLIGCRLWGEKHQVRARPLLYKKGAWKLWGLSICLTKIALSALSDNNVALAFFIETLTCKTRTLRLGEGGTGTREPFKKSVLKMECIPTHNRFANT